MSLALSGSSALEYVKLSDALEICNEVRKERGERGREEEGEGDGGGGSYTLVSDMRCYVPYSSYQTFGCS